MDLRLDVQRPEQEPDLKITITYSGLRRCRTPERFTARRQKENLGNGGFHTRRQPGADFLSC